MKGIWVMLLAECAVSCSPDIPECALGSRSGEKQEGITITVDTATTEYVFDIKM